VQDVNALLKQYREMQKLMKQLAGGRMGKFGFPGMGQ
jgi:signal recognition particle GTPase